MGPLLVLVSPCFRENIDVTCKFVCLVLCVCVGVCGGVWVGVGVCVGCVCSLDTFSEKT